MPEDCPDHQRNSITIIVVVGLRLVEGPRPSLRARVDLAGAVSEARSAPLHPTLRLAEPLLIMAAPFATPIIVKETSRGRAITD